MTIPLPAAGYDCRVVPRASAIRPYGPYGPYARDNDLALAVMIADAPEARFLG